MRLEDWVLISPGIYRRSKKLRETEPINLMPDLSSLDEDFKQIMLEMDKDLKEKTKMELKNQVIEVLKNDVWQLSSVEDLKPGETFRVKPIEDKVKYKEHLHGSKGENYERARQFGLNDNEAFMDKFAYSLYEVTFDMEVDTKTAESWILGINGVPLEKPVKA